MNKRTIRAGSWVSYACDVHSASRNYSRPCLRGSDFGLRLALDIVQPNRLLKSGSWFSLGWQIRSARRNHNDPDFRLRLFGLRLGLDGTKKSPDRIPVGANHEPTPHRS